MDVTSWLFTETNRSPVFRPAAVPASVICDNFAPAQQIHIAFNLPKRTQQSRTQPHTVTGGMETEPQALLWRETQGNTRPHHVTTHLPTGYLGWDRLRPKQHHRRHQPTPIKHSVVLPALAYRARIYQQPIEFHRVLHFTARNKFRAQRLFTPNSNVIKLQNYTATSFPTRIPSARFPTGETLPIVATAMR